MYRFARLAVISAFFFAPFLACQKENSIENGFTQNNNALPGTQSGTALFTLAGEPDDCVSPVISGEYKAGTALNASNTVEVLVNVTTVGSYTISTGATNGISFSATGDFTITGLQSIVLQGTGIPISTGTYYYRVGLAGCKFAITVQSATVPTTNCKACVYIPMCTGSTFTYIDTTAAGVNPPVTQALTFVRDTIVDGKVYQKFTAPPGQDFYYNCTAGVSTILTFNVSASGIVIPKLEQTMLKANSPVGTTWRNTVDLGSGVSAQYDWSIIAKGISRTVLGTTYPDVIQVHLTLSSVVPLVGTVVNSEGDYYYAKDVGLIDNSTYSVVSPPPVLQLHRVLQSYFIP